MMHEEALTASLRHQPLLIVVRPDASDLQGAAGRSSLLGQIQDLHHAGLLHLEVAWVRSPGWVPFVRRVQEICPHLKVGAASLTQLDALDDVQSCGLTPLGCRPVWIWHFCLAPGGWDSSWFPGS